MAHDTKQNESIIFAEEALVVNAQGLLQELLDEKGMTRADLARAMGVSRARVTQLFSDECKNFTIRLWARALFALGEDAVVTYAGSEDCLNSYLEGCSDDVRINRWEEPRSLNSSDCWEPANDNIFASLSAVRNATAQYEVAA